MAETAALVDDARTLVPRLLDRDAGLWPAGNVSADRLGWLDVAQGRAVEAVLEAVLTATGTNGKRKGVR